MSSSSTNPNGSAGTPAGELSEKGQRLRLGVGFWLGVAWLAAVLIAAMGSSWLPTADPNKIDIPNKLAGPFTSGYLLGADGLGRDIFARLVAGARVSLTVSLTAVSVGTVVGGALGVIAGYVRGPIDVALTATTSILLAFPGLVLLLGLVAFVGQSLTAISVVIGFLSIPIYARVARANTLSIVEREYVLAARALGAKSVRILIREVVPVVVLPLLAFGLTAIGVVIVLEGSLAFLGLSVEPPAATWGSMIAEGKRHLETTVHVALIPSAVMFLTVLSFNVVGDKLRSRLSGSTSRI